MHAVESGSVDKMTVNTYNAEHCNDFIIVPLHYNDSSKFRRFSDSMFCVNRVNYYKRQISNTIIFYIIFLVFNTRYSRLSFCYFFFLSERNRKNKMYLLFLRHFLHFKRISMRKNQQIIIVGIIFY